MQEEIEVWRWKITSVRKGRRDGTFYGTRTEAEQELARQIQRANAETAHSWDHYYPKQDIVWYPGDYLGNNPENPNLEREALTCADEYPIPPGVIEDYYGKNMEILNDPANNNRLAYRKEGDEHILYLREWNFPDMSSFHPGATFEVTVPAHHEQEQVLIRSHDFYPIAQYLWAELDFNRHRGFSAPFHS